MINKLKICFSLVAIFSFLFVVSLVSAANLTWSSDSVVDLSSPDINLTIASGSTATSLVVNTDGIVVTVDTGETFTLSSPNDLNISPITGPSGSNIAQSCSSSNVMSVTITGGTSSQAFTITPTSASCTHSSSGGGAISTPPPAAPATPAVPATPATPAVPTVSPATPATPATPAVPAVSVNKLTKAISTKSLKADVKNLQTALNTALGTTLAKPLVIDGKWGKKTVAAIKAFQKANGLKVDGVMGPKSRAALNALLGL